MAHDAWDRARPLASKIQAKQSTGEKSQLGAAHPISWATLLHLVPSSSCQPSDSCAAAVPLFPPVHVLFEVICTGN